MIQGGENVKYCSAMGYGAGQNIAVLWALERVKILQCYGLWSKSGRSELFGQRSQFSLEDKL